MATSSPADPPGPRANRLNGWKEIAAYLERGVRTVQRWEKTLGLPIRRLWTGKGEVVYALVEELDAWREAAERTRDLSERPGERDADDLPAGDPGAGHQEAEPADSRPAAGGAAQTERTVAQPAPDPVVPLPPPPAPGMPISSPPPRQGWRARAVALLAVIGAGALLLAAWQALSGPSGEPSDYLMDVETLRVFDAVGHELWTDRFAAPASRDPYSERYRDADRDPAVIEDLDGDGRREVILGYRSAAAPGEVRGYTAEGRRLFALKFEGSIRFGDTDYTPPWGPYRLFVTDKPGGGRWLWAVWNHDSGEFPTVVQRVSLQGKVEASFWSAGYVEWIQVAPVAGVPSILLGGANNDHRGASLALFDIDAVTGSMPAETWDKTCRTCPPNLPRKFLVFPRLDVMELVLGHPSVVSTLRQETGEFRAYVDHGAFPPPEGLQWGGTIAYDLAPDLTPVLAEFDQQYLSAHERHRIEGLLDHAFGDADRAAAWPVLVWENGTWSKVTGRTDR